ncbi:MAG: hypothetical protein LBK91_04455 [Synergistaceae bacterium]|nr:hypothetical protein [Synergistaceae bacterium]
MKHDLDLANKSPTEKLPEIVVERLDFTRAVNGREWHVEAMEADSESNVIKARSIDINVYEAATKRSSRVLAKRGEFARAHSKVWLWDVDGMVFMEDRSVDFFAARADYDTSSDIWFFGEGISASDDRVHVKGGTAKIDSSGVLTLGKGARIHWKTE